MSIEKRLDELDEDKLTVDAIKVSHHGGKKNTSASLLNLINAQRFLISTNGGYYGHPDPETVARIIRYGGKQPIFEFNYRVPKKNLVWNKRILMRGKNGKDSYKARYPNQNQEGCIVVLNK